MAPGQAPVPMSEETILEAIERAYGRRVTVSNPMSYWVDRIEPIEDEV